MNTRFAMIIETPGEFDDYDVVSGITHYIREYSNELASRIKINIESAEDYRESEDEWQSGDENYYDCKKASKNYGEDEI